MFSKLSNSSGLLIPCVACLFPAKCLESGFTAVFNFLLVWGGKKAMIESVLAFFSLKLFVANTTSHINQHFN